VPHNGQGHCLGRGIRTGTRKLEGKGGTNKDLGSATENGPGTTSTSRARTQKSQPTIHIINKTNKGKTSL